MNEEDNGLSCYITDEDTGYPILIVNNGRITAGYNLDPVGLSLTRVCICSAWKPSECCCGAWDDVNDDYED